MPTAGVRLAVGAPLDSDEAMRYRFLWIGFAVLLGCISVLLVVMATRSDLPAALAQVEGVARVERAVPPGRPICRIIHIADYHFVPRDDLTAHLRDKDPDVTDAHIDAEYQRMLTKVRRVQANQLRLISWLAKEHGVRVVHLEGLTAANRTHYSGLISLASQGGLDDKMRLGAAGQAIMAGAINDVAPAEDEGAYHLADPTAALAKGGGVLGTIGGPGNDAREESMVRRLAAGGPLVVVVLEAAHDLSRQVKKLDGCEYLKVYVDGVED